MGAHRLRTYRTTGPATRVPTVRAVRTARQSPIGSHDARVERTEPADRTATLSPARSRPVGTHSRAARDTPFLDGEPAAGDRRARGRFGAGDPAGDGPPRPAHRLRPLHAGHPGRRPGGRHPVLGGSGWRSGLLGGARLPGVRSRAGRVAPSSRLLPPGPRPPALTRPEFPGLTAKCTSRPPGGEARTGPAAPWPAPPDLAPWVSR